MLHHENQENRTEQHQQYWAMGRITENAPKANCCLGQAEPDGAPTKAAHKRTRRGMATNSPCLGRITWSTVAVPTSPEGDQSSLNCPSAVPFACLQPCMAT